MKTAADLFYQIPISGNPVTSFFKRVVLRCARWLLLPLTEEILQEQNEKIVAFQEKEKSKLDIMLQQEQQLEQHYTQFVHEYKLEDKDRTDKLGAVARDITHTKWTLRDHLADLNHEEQEVTCIVCGYHALENTFEKKETDCIFGGGHLLRYVCPVCGCIFGPKKFLEQTGKELADDYVVHYMGYSESDCTQQEIATFFLLNPTKSGQYLNYGCGCWGKSIQYLRSIGYQVYGYEPFASDVENPYIITDRAEIDQMKFNGIFSHDLLEHLTDPVGDMKFMRSLLVNAESKIVHATLCFDYRQEGTRFHVAFFTGNSPYVLAQRSGCKVLRSVRCNHGYSLLAYVFGMADSGVDGQHAATSVELTGAMLRVDHQNIGENGWILKPSELLAGPCLSLPQGTYHFMIQVEIPDSAAEIACMVTYAMGKEKGETVILKNGKNNIDDSCNNRRRAF